MYVLFLIVGFTLLTETFSNSALFMLGKQSLNAQIYRPYHLISYPILQRGMTHTTVAIPTRNYKDVQR